MIGRVISLVAVPVFALLAGALPTAAQDWQLVWSEEFDVDGLVDESKWSYDVGGGGWGNQELQYYTERRSENVRVEDGHLVIEAINEPFGGREYTSGRIVTRGKGDWLYGRFEVRAKLPPGLGTWPAIWMLSTDSDYGRGIWPDTGEIDIMEAVGHDPGRTHSSVHTQALNSLDGSNPSNSVAVPDSYTAFHVYALEWTPTRITTFVDGEVNLVYERSGATWQRWPFDRPFHLLLNLAVGGTWGGLEGVDPDDFPTQMVVDFVRVYEDAAGPPDVSFTGVSGPIQIDPGSDLSIEAVATDPVSDIVSVTIYQGDAELASAPGATTSAVVEDVYPGCYEVRAVALDSDGWFGSSNPVDVSVGDTCGQAPYLMRAHRIPGRIEAEHYDIGGSGVAFTDLTPANTGTGYRQSEAVDIGPSLDAGGGFRIQDVTRREWVEYTVHVEQGGLYRMIGRVAGLQDGSFRVSVNGEELPNPFTYASTNSESFYRSAVLEGISLQPGPAVIRLSFDGPGTLLNWIEFDLISGTSTDDVAAVPGRFSVDAVYPEPFTGALTVDWSAASRPDVDVRLFDVMGREVWSTRFNAGSGERGSGTFRTDRLPPGVYLLRIDDGGEPVDRLVTKARR